MQTRPRTKWITAVMAPLTWFTSLSSVARADESPTDKSGYHLFDPTPRPLMRELSPDRPDATESPYTVDAGHAQFEISFVDYTHDDDDGRDLDAWTVFDTTAKIGLTNDLDLHLVFGAYGQERVEPVGGSDETARGFSDVTVRAKLNLWGNDRGDTAFAVMPFVKIPTGTELSNDRWEGGVLGAFGWSVAENWGLGFMAEVDAVYDDQDDDHDAEFLHSAVLGLDLVGPLGAYIEYVGIVSTESAAEYAAIFSAGLTWALSEDVQLDVGAQLGLTEAADDLNVFTGITIRF